MRRVLPGSLLAGLAALAWGFSNTDALVARGFATAIAEATPTTTVRLADGGKLVSGNEDFWLGRALDDTLKPVVWQAKSAMGNRFTLTANGAERTLEVVDVRSLATTDDKRAAVSIVTCRDVADPTANPLRIVLEAGQTLPGLVLHTGPHAL